MAMLTLVMSKEKLSSISISTCPNDSLVTIRAPFGAIINWRSPFKGLRHLDYLFKVGNKGVNLPTLGFPHLPVGGGGYYLEHQGVISSTAGQGTRRARAEKAPRGARDVGPGGRPEPPTDRRGIPGAAAAPLALLGAGPPTRPSHPGQKPETNRR